jgi:large subunit ribosomal protein L14
MIQVGTHLKVADNSGAREVYCIGVLSGYKQRYSYIGDIIKVSVRKIRNRRRESVKIKKGEISDALIVRTKFSSVNNTGLISFFENSVVLLTKQKKLVGTRLFGAFSKSFRTTKYMRLAFLGAGILK